MQCINNGAVEPVLRYLSANGARRDRQSNKSQILAIALPTIRTHWGFA
jgi:hypothetical protein